MQFTIRTILVVMLFLASSMGTFGSMGTVGVVIGLCLALYLLAVAISVKHARHLKRSVLLGLFFWVVVIPLTILLLLPTISRARPAALRMQCTCTMKQLAIGLLNYHDAYGSFPPAYTTDNAGEPTHSWRTLLLPEIEEGVLYKKIDLSSPWNSNTNEKPLAKVPYPFQCYATRWRNENPNKTGYVAVTGSGTMWSTKGLPNVADPDNTIMLIEIADSNIHWAEPRDLTLDEVLEPRGGKNRSRCDHHLIHEEGLFTHPVPTSLRVVTAAGRVRDFAVRPSRDELIGLFDPGPKSIDIEAMAARGRSPRIKWSAILSLAIMLASYAAFCLTPLWPKRETPSVEEQKSMGDEVGCSP